MSFYSAQERTNRFSEAEREEDRGSSNTAVVPGFGPATDDGDGGLEGEDNPVPIDDYVPALLVTAVGIIIYTLHPKKKKRSVS